MFNILFVFLNLAVILCQTQYGVLEAGQHIDFSVSISNPVEVCLLSFQGPIKLAKVNEDQTLTDIEPLPGTYFYYDYPNNVTGKYQIYRAYGSQGGATYPQYKFVPNYYFYKIKPTELQTYQNMSIKSRSEDGYLIIDIPLILQRNEQYIGDDSFIIFLGQKQDAETLRLLSRSYQDLEIKPSTATQNYYPMSYSNYQTTLYVKLDPRDNYNYFSVSDEHYLLLGGQEFEPQFEKNNQKTWIWILITLFAVLILVGVLIFRAKRKLKTNEENIKVLEHSIQEYN